MKMKSMGVKTNEVEVIGRDEEWELKYTQYMIDWDEGSISNMGCLCLPVLLVYDAVIASCLLTR
jgi:hypothetical protein